MPLRYGKLLQIKSIMTFAFLNLVCRSMFITFTRLHFTLKDGQRSRIMGAEEKLATLIEKITTRVFDEKQNNFFNIIRGNLEISKQQIAELKKQRIKTKHRTY